MKKFVVIFNRDKFILYGKIVNIVKDMGYIYLSNSIKSTIF